jgi:hypothetical protein
MKETILFFVLIWSDGGYFSTESPLKFESEETCLAFAEDQERSIKELSNVWYACHFHNLTMRNRTGFKNDQETVS